MESVKRPEFYKRASEHKKDSKGKLVNFTQMNQKIIEEINLARTCPSEYAAKLERFSTKIINNKKVKIGSTEMNLTEGQEVFDEAIQYLLNISALDPLEQVEGLSKSADELLSVLIIQEGVNMKDIEPSIYELEKRLDHFGVFFGEFCELINYGIKDPEVIVMYFILGDGDDLRRDRKIIFNPLLKYVGISSGTLPSENNCTIINFVQYFYKPGEEIPENMLNRYTYRHNADRFQKIRQQSREAYLDKKEQYREHFENIYPDEPKSMKKIKKVREVKKKTKDKLTGQEIVIVKKTIIYEDGEEEVQTYNL